MSIDSTELPFLLRRLLLCGTSRRGVVMFIRVPKKKEKAKITPELMLWKAFEKKAKRLSKANSALRYTNREIERNLVSLLEDHSPTGIPTRSQLVFKCEQILALVRRQ